MKLFSTFAPARRLDVRIEESWSQFGPHRWLVERFAPRVVIQREITRVLVLNLLWQTRGVKNTGRTRLSLTPPSPLSTASSHLWTEILSEQCEFTLGSQIRTSEKFIVNPNRNPYLLPSANRLAPALRH